jgi:hypothetical protein
VKGGIGGEMGYIYSGQVISWFKVQHVGVVG